LIEREKKDETLCNNILPSDTNAKTGENYNTLPQTLSATLDITEEIVKKVAWCLSRSASPGGSDAQTIHST
jgi:hypothetical protein